MIEEMKDIFELATSATTLIKEVLKLKNNKKEANEDNLNKVSCGNSAQIGSSGYSAQIGSSGDYAKIGSSGNSAQIESSGDNSVVTGIGYKTIIKAKKGSWITLAEYDNDCKPICVKSVQIDGDTLKEDTYYCLYNQEFKEVQIIDGIKTIVEKRKKNVIKGRFLDSYDECYVVEQDGIYSHGETIKQAKESLIYKISNRDTSFYNDYTLDTEITKEEAIKMYRVITGACEQGTKHFCETHKIPKKMTVRKAIELTQGQYNCEKLQEFFNK